MLLSGNKLYIALSQICFKIYIFTCPYIRKRQKGDIPRYLQWLGLGLVCLEEILSFSLISKGEYLFSEQKIIT